MTSNGISCPDQDVIQADVRSALAEDIGSGDVTADLIDADSVFSTRVICRQHAILAGRPWFDETFRQIDPSIEIDWHIDDGDPMHPDIELCRLRGPARAILSGERTALNFIQTLSASATMAGKYCDEVAGTRAVILDTRKTIPGLRLAQKYAVRCGGASNHRIGLFDAFLIKENHIAARGSLSAAIKTAAEAHPDLLLEVEVETLEQLREAIAAGAQRALLDNFTIEQLARAVELHGNDIDLEASGGVSLHTVREIALTGVDYISTGELTKHVMAVDFSMRFV